MNTLNDSAKQQISEFTDLAKINLFYQEKHNQIKQEWKKFMEGADDINPSHVTQEILKSWRRCRKMKIDPFSKPEHAILKGAALKRLLHENQELQNVSLPFLNRLKQFVKSSFFTVGLCDARGYLLSVINEATVDKTSPELNWVPGALWTEGIAGTNIVSAVLHLKKPVRIFGPQHYKKIYHYITASGAPVFGPRGELMGGIFLNGFYYSTNPHTLGMVMAAAQAIENELKAQRALADCQAAFSETEIAASLRRAVISSIPEALIALDGKNSISIINDKARKKFIPTRRTGEGDALQSVFAGPENAAFVKLVLENESFTDVEAQIFSRGEYADYTLTCQPILTTNGQKIGKILIFSEIKRIQSLVAKVIGAKANYRFADIQGHNPQFDAAIEQARIVSQSSSNVLILGESGTGKDIFAQAIHNASPRMNGPYVAINCAAIPRDLIASELFGYSEGAFTGSRRGGNQGKFELADGGTIFLDEIAETPLELQAVLLRAIEEKAVVRIGEGHVRPVDVRIISATNRDLVEEVRKGNFRKDLFYRLNVFAISIPPLRERTDDIPMLMDAFVQKYSAALNKKITRVDKKIWGVFMKYAWPGNVRELQNVVERMINYASSAELTVDLIPPEIKSSSGGRRKNEKIESPEEAEKKMIHHLLTLKFRKNQIADRLNMSRVTLFRKIKKYGLADT